MDSERLRDISYAEFVDAWVTPTGLAHDSEVHTRAGTHVFKSRSDSYWFNGMMRSNSFLPADEAVDWLNQFLGDQDCKVFIRDWADDDLENAALKIDGAELLDGNIPIMAAKRPVEVTHADLEIVGEMSDKLVGDFRAICVPVFSEGEDAEFRGPLEVILRYNDEIFEAPSSHIFIGYNGDGEACTAAQLRFSNGIAGLYWVATAELQRKRGYAMAMCTYLMKRAFDAGAQAVTLQTSSAEKFYERLGFETVGAVRTVKVTRSATSRASSL